VLVVTLPRTIFRAVHGVMAGEFAANPFVGIHLIGHRLGLATKVRAKDRLQIANANTVNMEAAGRAARFDKSKHHVLFRPCAATILGLAFEATVERFVHRDHATIAAQALGRQRAWLHGCDRSGTMLICKCCPRRGEAELMRFLDEAMRYNA
jgi:hypothetical protein